MEADDNQAKPTFSKKGAWLGFFAYVVVAAVIAAIYLFG